MLHGSHGFRNGNRCFFVGNGEKGVGEIIDVVVEYAIECEVIGVPWFYFKCGKIRTYRKEGVICCINAFGDIGAGFRDFYGFECGQDREHFPTFCVIGQIENAVFDGGIGVFGGEFH